MALAAAPTASMAAPPSAAAPPVLDGTALAVPEAEPAAVPEALGTCLATQSEAGALLGSFAVAAP